MSTQINVTTGATTSVNVSDPSGYSQENIEDFVDSLLVGGESISKTYDDVNGTLTIALASIDGGDATS